MTSIFSYGGYSHADNEVNVDTHTVHSVYDQSGFRKSVVHRLECSGKLHADTPALVSIAMRVMQTAYNRENQIAVLKIDGANTHHRITPIGSIMGVQVTDPPSWIGDDGSEFTTYRSYRFAVEAEYYVTGRFNLLDFEETVTVTGTGGPRLVVIETLDTAPVMQLTNRQTRVTIVQAGRALGLRFRPTPPSPLFPAGLQGPSASIGKRSARERASNTEHEVTWSYTMLAVGPVNAEPHNF